MQEVSISNHKKIYLNIKADVEYLVISSLSCSEEKGSIPFLGLYTCYRVFSYMDLGEDHITFLDERPSLSGLLSIS